MHTGANLILGKVRDARKNVEKGTGFDRLI